MMKGHPIPLVYFLLQRKTEYQYVKALSQQNSCLDPTEVVVGFEKASINALEKRCTSLHLTSAFSRYVENFEDVCIGHPGRFGRRTKPQIEVTLWSKFCNAASGSQKTNNSVEGWHRAFQMTMGCAHPTLHKFINFLHREQSHSENRVARIRAGEKVEKKAMNVKRQEGIQHISSNYQNNRILK